MSRIYIGADLARDKVDIYHPKHNTHHQIKNNARAISAYLRKMQEDEVLIFEATSGCDDIIMTEVRSESTAYVRVNPMHAWHFARACNLPKTDKVDAKMLSAYGAARALEPQRPNSIARDRLKALVKRRRQYKEMQVQEKNRLKRIADPELKRDIESVLNIFQRRVDKLEKQIMEHVNTCEELRNICRILESTPGIGPVTASVLIADMPELGMADRRQIVSLAGLAPRAFESGKYKGRRRLAPGRRNVRKVLYMAALSVVAQGKYFQPFIKRMKSEGKAPKTIIMAIARKLLTILNSLVNKQILFDGQKMMQIANPQ